MPLQVQGFSGTNVEVEANTGAMRVNVRPIDVGSLGSYSVCVDSGTMAAGLAANSPIFSFRWTDATRFAIVRRISCSAASLTGFAQGFGKLDVFFARSFSASDSGGTTITVATNSNKRRTSFGTSLVGDLRTSSTATLTAGTRTLDSQPLNSFVFNPGTAGATTLFQNANLWRPDPTGDWPLVLAQNEGFVVQASVPGTGTWVFSMVVEWSELAAYP